MVAVLPRAVTAFDRIFELVAEVDAVHGKLFGRQVRSANAPVELEDGCASPLSIAFTLFILYISELKLSIASVGVNVVQFSPRHFSSDRTFNTASSTAVDI